MMFIVNTVLFEGSHCEVLTPFASRSSVLALSIIIEINRAVSE